MRPVSQTILHTQDGPPGNCMQACVASVLELPLEEVPHFCADNRWPFNFHEWLNERGLFFLEVSFAEHGIDARADYMGYHLIAGPSPRGNFLHSVVALNGEMVFDPHPDRTGLAGDLKDWLFGFLIERK